MVIAFFGLAVSVFLISVYHLIKDYRGGIYGLESDADVSSITKGSMDSFHRDVYRDPLAVVHKITSALDDIKAMNEINLRNSK